MKLGSINTEKIQIPIDCNLDDIKTFEKLYKDHCQVRYIFSIIYDNLLYIIKVSLFLIVVIVFILLTRLIPFMLFLI
jgi:hypothetical protein